MGKQADPRLLYQLRGSRRACVSAVHGLKPVRSGVASPSIIMLPTCKTLRLINSSRPWTHISSGITKSTSSFLWAHSVPWNTGRALDSRHNQSKFCAAPPTVKFRSAATNSGAFTRRRQEILKLALELCGKRCPNCQWNPSQPTRRGRRPILRQTCQMRGSLRGVVRSVLHLKVDTKIL